MRLAASVALCAWIVAAPNLCGPILGDHPRLLNCERVVRPDHRLPHAAGAPAADAILQNVCLPARRIDPQPKAGNFAVPDHVLALGRLRTVDDPLREFPPAHRSVLRGAKPVLRDHRGTTPADSE